MTDPEPSLASSWRLDALSRRKSVLIWTALAVFAAAQAFTFGLPDVYRTSTTLLVEGSASVTGPEAERIDPAGRLQLIKQEALGRAQLGSLLKRFDPATASAGPAAQEDAISQLRRDIRVEPLRDQMTASGHTIAFQVSYVGRDPQTSADVTNAVAAFFVEQNGQLLSGQSSRVLEVLEAEINETRTRLEQQEAQVRGYTARNLGALPQQLETNLAAISRLDAQLGLNGAERLRLMERRQSITAELATIGSQKPDDDDPTLAGQLAALEARLADLRSRFGNEYPDVRSLQAEIGTVRAAMAAEARNPPAAARRPELTRSDAHTKALAEIDGQLARLSSEDESLRQRIAAYERRVETVPANAPAFDGLIRDHQATRDRLDELQKRYDEARLTERAGQGGATEQFRILDAAVPSSAAAGPSRILLAGIGLFLALACGVAAAIVADQLDTTLHSVDELRRFTNIPVLTSIPEIGGARKGAGRRAGELALAGAAVVMITALAGGAFYVAQAGYPISRVLSRVL